MGDILDHLSTLITILDTCMVQVFCLMHIRLTSLIKTWMFYWICIEVRGTMMVKGFSGGCRLFHFAQIQTTRSSLFAFLPPKTLADYSLLSFSPNLMPILHKFHLSPATPILKAMSHLPTETAADCVLFLHSSGFFSFALSWKSPLIWDIKSFQPDSAFEYFSHPSDALLHK